ncbi:TRAP transporter small permease [Sneathiella sp. HT1-7]|uniref:TRAP transporter small permease n=1 Tax=Sneathiella sp. HT1-7 TaxID=2887192 RepID=UPI001D14D5A4|nr:TRAP transporter small permease [Sneathiella sp. HT1-7]MCC3304340.1 TRAP transporter small permease [Sneathiella sp. HT1-7]
MERETPRRKATFKLLDRILRPLENGAAIIGAAMMLAAMIITTFDALLRYTINRPLSFNYFLTEQYLLVGLVCLPLAWGFRTGGFIRITFLLHVIPQNVGNLLLRVGLLVSSMFCADLAWMSGQNWYEIYSKGLVEMDVIDWPVHLSWIWVPIGCGLLSLRLLLSVFAASEDLIVEHTAEEYPE